jgi:hypothetical protein
MPPPPSAFLDQIIRFLMPFFIGTSIDALAARAEIIETLSAYATRTRAEMLNAAQIIAFSMSALDTLAEAKTQDLSPTLRLRFRGCANSLNRATQQNEKTLDQRLCADPPIATPPAPEPVDDIANELAQATLEQARTKIETHRNRLAVGTPNPQQAAPHKRPWATTMIDNLHQMGLPSGQPPSG